MAVSISELLEEIGNSNLRVQNIRTSTIGVKSNSKHGDNEVTFCTDQLTPGDFATGCGKTGYVVWFTQEQHDEAMKKIKDRKSK